MFYDLYTIASILRKISFIPTLICFAYVWTSIKGEGVSFFSNDFWKNMSFVRKKILMICVHFVFILAILLSTKYVYVAVLDSDDIRLMPDGEYCYYVRAENENGKRYKLKAQITKEGDEYMVDRLFFSNGGYIWINSDSFRYGEKGSGTDEDHEEWEVKIINDRARHRKVDNPEFEISFHEISSLLEVSLQAFALIAHARELYKYKKQESSLHQINLFDDFQEV